MTSPDTAGWTTQNKHTITVPVLNGTYVPRTSVVDESGRPTAARGKSAQNPHD